MPVQSVQEKKAELRRRFAARRRQRDVTPRAPADALAALVLAQIPIVAETAGNVVAGYWPLPGEMDPRPLMLALAARGSRLCLPVVEGRGRPLTFRAWRPGDKLQKGPFNLSQPDPSAPVMTPDYVLTPLLAFDRFGVRLGHGAGYYDLTLARLRASGSVCKAIGIAYDDQEFDRLPNEDHDQRLDWIVTEKRAIKALEDI